MEPDQPSWRVRQGYLPAGDFDLLVTVHEQATTAAPAVIMSGGLGVNSTEPRYLLTLAARELANRGLTVLQYDHPAEGDSTGDPRKVTAADLLKAGQRVRQLAGTLTSGPVAAVGYGFGNAVVSSLLADGGLAAAALIAPCLRGWEQDWSALIPPSADGLIAPDVTADGTRLGDIWRALYGEPVVPSQPPGPLGADLIAELSDADLGLRARSGDSGVLVISDLADDLAAASEVVLLKHEATPAEPSWHWNLRNRTVVINGLAAWLGDRLKRRSGAGPQPRPRASGHTEAEDASQPGGLRTATRDRSCSTRSVRIAGDSIFGVLRLPDRPDASAPVCVVYETGNPGQRVDIHRCGPVLAASLAARGLACFRYDPRGMGASCGSYADMTWSRRVDDLTAVLDALEADRFRSVVILGNSAGARTAMRVAARDQRVAGLVLWGPILREEAADGAAPKLIRVPGGLATEWCGLPLGLRYQRDLRESDYLAEFTAGTTPACVIFAEQEPDLANREAVLAAAARRGAVTVRTAPGPHGFSWPGLLVAIEHSVRWIETTVADRTDR